MILNQEYFYLLAKYGKNPMVEFKAEIKESPEKSSYRKIVLDEYVASQIWKNFQVKIFLPKNATKKTIEKNVILNRPEPHSERPMVVLYTQRVMILLKIENYKFELIKAIETVEKLPSYARFCHMGEIELLASPVTKNGFVLIRSYKTPKISKLTFEGELEFEAYPTQVVKGYDDREFHHSNRKMLKFVDLGDSVIFSSMSDFCCLYTPATSLGLNRKTSYKLYSRRGQNFRIWMCLERNPATKQPGFNHLVASDPTLLNVFGDVKLFDFKINFLEFYRLPPKYAKKSGNRLGSGLCFEVSVCESILILTVINARLRKIVKTHYLSIAYLCSLYDISLQMNRKVIIDSRTPFYYQEDGGCLVVMCRPSWDEIAVFKIYEPYLFRKEMVYGFKHTHKPFGRIGNRFIRKKDYSRAFKRLNIYEEIVRDQQNPGRLATKELGPDSGLSAELLQSLSTDSISPIFIGEKISVYWGQDKTQLILTDKEGALIYDRVKL